ncbi:hypothetical protein OIE69_44430 (plasmid) [Actinacidiphila glaucinigra]|uniref:hypothetical protein n=1 Tax=Actinacidiphila glaucinigra TaxID=235986 RepID=UPI002DDA65A9|nr:hypothetical protein [Actinacidiphila glaucinigra]WSD65759.1 hypothetical protein OIE69_43420 [Actinacidiphila glaucinigra]WSD65953.1 hypothetical protein OIE69_44430 [Actinacidiphila glaucinigra]
MRFQQPTIDTASPEGCRITDLFDRFKDQEHGDDNWSGADVTQILTTWFGEMGFDTEGPAYVAFTTTPLDIDPVIARTATLIGWRLVRYDDARGFFEAPGDLVIDFAVTYDIDGTTVFALDPALGGSKSVEGPQKLRLSPLMTTVGASSFLTAKLYELRLQTKEWALTAARGR